MRAANAKLARDHFVIVTVDTATLQVSVDLTSLPGPPDTWDYPLCMGWHDELAMAGSQNRLYLHDFGDVGAKTESLFQGNFDAVTWDGEAFRVHAFPPGPFAGLGFIRVSKEGKQLTEMGEIVPITAIGDLGYRVSTDPVTGRSYYLDFGFEALMTRAYDRDGALLWKKVHAPLPYTSLTNAIAADAEGAWVLVSGESEKQPRYERLFRLSPSGDLSLVANVSLPVGEYTDSDRGVFARGASDTWIVLPTRQRVWYAELVAGVMSPPRIIVDSGAPVVTKENYDIIKTYLLRTRIVHPLEVGEQKWVVLQGDDGVRLLRIDDPSCVYPSMNPYPGGLL